MSTERSGPEVQIQGPKQVRKCKTMKAGNGGPSRQHFLHLHGVPPLGKTWFFVDQWPALL